MALDEYEQKRDFTHTTEPPGTTGQSEDVFVIQEHHASHLHFDFRLARDGVLVSWAVPKNLPEDSSKRLAMQVEDHPLGYENFEGEIPEGSYGAGTVKIWDKGMYETLEWTEKQIRVVLHGIKIQGQYILRRWISKGENVWLVFKSGS